MKSKLRPDLAWVDMPHSAALFCSGESFIVGSHIVLFFNLVLGDFLRYELSSLITLADLDIGACLGYFFY